MIFMSELDRKIYQLISSACKYPVQSPERQQKLGLIYQLTMKSGKLWQEQTYYYNDALQDTWEYFSMNLEQYAPSIEMLCQIFLQVSDLQNLKRVSQAIVKSGWNWKDKTLEAKWEYLSNSQRTKNDPHFKKAISWVEELETKIDRLVAQKEQKKSLYYIPEYYQLRNLKRVIIWLSINTWLDSEYQPSLKSVITWLDDLLKKRLAYYAKVTSREKNRQIEIPNRDNEQIIDPIDTLSAPSDIEPVLAIWQATLNWVEKDPQGILRNTYFRKYPDINARVLILQRLPPNIPDWANIAAQWHLNPAETKDLPKFYSRHCRPLLRQFGIDRGYI